MAQLLLTYLPTILGTLILIVLVASKKEKSPVRLYFIIFNLSLMLWQLAFFATNILTRASSILFVARIGLVLATVMAVSFVIFSLVYPLREKVNTKIKIILLVSLAVLIPICLSPITLKLQPNSPRVFEAGQYSLTSGLGYTIDTIYAVVLFGISLGVLIYKKIKMPIVRDQINFIFTGITIAVIVNFLVNFVFANYPFANNINFIGVYSIFVLQLMIGLAVIRHKLFDITALTARAASYITLLSFVAVVYVLLFYIFGVVVFGLDKFSIGQNVFIIFAIATSVTFSPYLQRKFNKITNKLFFRDSYDAQDVINKVNSTLVNTLNIDKLLTNTINIITSEVKVAYIDFYLESRTTNFHSSNQKRELFNDPKWQEFVKYFTKKNHRVIQISDTSLSVDISAIMKDLQIEGAFKMVSGGKSVGILIAGPRKSGKELSMVDIQLLEIIADEVAITVQNALRFEEIENFNLTLQGKVDEATRKLRRANEKLKALDESKDDFISMASHQLRTPLTSIKGYISMVLEGDAGKVSPMQHEMLGQAFFSSQRMVYLISDLLNVSRLKTGKFVIERSRVNLATMVAQELDQLKETAAARQLTLTHDSPKNFPDLMLDETKTRQVIMNFVDNAIYYTPAGGHINVKLIDNPNNVELRVEDDGIGVSVSDQHHLFTKFYRAGNARKARPDGTGLGLFMAKKVIIAEEGSLIFDSKEGKGSTFGFVFYKSKAGVK